MPIVELPSTCQGCGACCYGLVVEVTPEDLAGHGTPAALTTEGMGGRRVMRQVEADHQRCVALNPETRECTIYANRPQVCRDFTRADEAGGNRMCLEAVGTMANAQKRVVLPRRPPVEAAIEALAALTTAAWDAAPAPAQVELLDWCARMVALGLPRVLAEHRARLRAVERTVALLAHANPEALRPAATGLLADAAGGFDVAEGGDAPAPT